MATRTLATASEIGVPVPTQQGLEAWSHDPAGGRENSIVLGSGYLHMVRLVPARDVSVTKVYVHLLAGGASLTAAQNFAGLYDATGARLGVTTDQAASWATSGAKTMSLTGAVAVTTGTPYYVGLLVNHTGTSPSFMTAATGVASINAGMVGPWRWQYETTGSRTTLPSPTSSGNWAAYDAAIWTAISQ